MMALGAALTLSACGQGVGDRCQIPSDCKNNLVCVLPPGVTQDVGGTCRDNTTSTDQATPFDFSAVSVDLSVVD
ncbi:MAG: hypothetical protein ABI445_06880 [Polyangia bacterium]